jgi:beta-lactamase class D
MKSVFLCILIILLSFSALFAQKAVVENKYSQIKTPQFKSILDSAQVDGAILIFDASEGVFYSNNFRHCKKGYLPASTFKIVNSIIALETGAVEDLNTMFYWDSIPRRLDIWNQDLNFHDAFHASCVPCFQEIARKIGVETMNEYITKFSYGKMDVNSENIDYFWLEGKSKISQFQQIDFLVSFYNEKLGISKRSTKIMKDLMIIEETDKGILSGKTGWAIRNRNNTGWFVGYFEAKNGKVLFIATNIQPHMKFNMDMFPTIRKNISLKAIELILQQK